MNDHFKQITLEATNAVDLKIEEKIQSLWSGYGSIVRLKLRDCKTPTVVAKHIQIPTINRHPRGWNTDLSHNRKIKSYNVETHFYQNYANNCNDACKVPSCFVIEQSNNELFIVLEDLDSAGFSKRKSMLTFEEMIPCIKWLANFHAVFINTKPEGLWETGTYWHLETRPDELKALSDKKLQKAASKIDEVLKNTKYKTLVHGDAKVANFCFNNEGTKVAAVDFQYVGGGCGMKDLTYFAGSCLYEEDCEDLEQVILDTYFQELHKGLKLNAKQVNFSALEKEWREMYYYAWTDFHRFLKGWSPGHWKINSYSEKVSHSIISSLL